MNKIENLKSSSCSPKVQKSSWKILQALRIELEIFGEDTNRK